MSRRGKALGRKTQSRKSPGKEVPEKEAPEKNPAEKKAALSAGLKNTVYLLGYVRRHVPALFYTNILTGILWGYLNVASSVLVIQVVFNMIGEGRSFADVCSFLLLMSMILLPVLGAIYYCEKRLWPALKLKLGKTLHTELFQKAREMDLRCYDDAGFYTDFIWTVQEAEEHVYAAVRNMGSVLLTVLACIGVIAIMLEIDPLLLVIAVFSMVFQFLLRLLKSRIEFLREQRLMPLVKKYEYINRVFYMPDYAKELRMSRVDRLLTEEFDDCISKMDTVYRKLQFRLSVLDIGEQACNVFLTNMFLIFVLAYKILIAGSVSIGDLSVSIAAVGKLNSMYNGLLTALSQSVQSGMFAEKLQTFLAAQPQITSPKDAAALPEASGDIEFCNVSFRYDGSDIWVLRHINLKIKAQTRAAIVGYNGAGKSTLVKLLMRLYDPTEGEILLNGRNIKEYDVEEYRRSFGTLFQDFQIYAASVGENVKMGLVDAGDETAIREALKTAGIAENFSGLSALLLREYDRNGRLVSGGEAQKIAMARAFLKDPHTYILDEPSSALDPISEYNLNRTLFEVSKGRTVIFISHRLSTTRMAERIYMMEQGRIIEEGTHEELLEKGGRYAEMFEKQAEKYRNSFVL